MSASTGHTFLPVLSHNPDGNYRMRAHDYVLGLGTRIVPCLAHSANSANKDGDIVRIFEVYVSWIHVADTASLESALAILSDKYTSSPPAAGSPVFEGINT